MAPRTVKVRKPRDIGDAIRVAREALGVAFAVLGTGTIVAAVIIGAIKRPPVSAITAREATSGAPAHASTR